MNFTIILKDNQIIYTSELAVGINGLVIKEAGVWFVISEKDILCMYPTEKVGSIDNDLRVRNAIMPLLLPNY